MIKASVKAGAPNGAVKKGEVVTAVVVRVAKEYGRPMAAISGSTRTLRSLSRPATIRVALVFLGRLPVNCATAIL